MATGATRAPSHRATVTVLVEGESDAAAITTLLTRLGRRPDDCLRVRSAHGVTNFRRLVAEYHVTDLGHRVVGLYDAPEERVVRRALEQRGLDPGAARSDIEHLGFFACVDDLEDEMIRALGVGRVLRLLESQGELEAFRTMQKQPAQRGRPVDQQLRRFLGTKATRKVRYGHVLAAAVDLDRCPEPLRRLLAAATG